MQFKHELRDKFASLDNQITYFPDSLLNKNFYLVNEYKELFQGRYGPNVDRFNNYLTIISRNPILNNLFILFKGNVDFYNLTAELKHEYLNKIEARMELGKEAFDNGIVELRRQYIKDKEKFLTEFNLNEIQQISQNTQLYYESLKNLIQEYREQMIASNDEEEIEFVLVEDDEE
ncbi:hypothetical protein CKF59_00295 [Psittacicella gerlachiana]|uniref:Uncharacterized protein n=2 Tax=Psittacicella gerlachiana TaxID=2028574 RepID=A0A3A1YQV0_9GAMM|nr:hypothetical protein CKF59_00295 [Psittacicella gerlachiana]